MNIKYTATYLLILFSLQGCDSTPIEIPEITIEGSSSSSSFSSSFSFSQSSIVSSSSSSSILFSSSTSSALANTPLVKSSSSAPTIVISSSLSSSSSEVSSAMSSESSSEISSSSSSSNEQIIKQGALTCNVYPQSNGIFASPTGKASATGTLDDPLDLTTALSSDSPIQSGETLWLLGGTYNGTYTSTISGTSSAYINVRPYNRAHVKIDSNVATKGSGLQVDGQYINFYDLEIMSSDANRVSAENSSGPTDISLLNGVNIFAANSNIINFVIHDNAGGISTWRTSSDANSELYGNIIYNNGWHADGRGHGHAIYAQNRIGYKKITNNIIFFGFGTGIHIYTEGGQINNFDIKRNVWFMTGASDERSSQQKDNCLVGGYQPVINLHVEDNMGWAKRRGTRIGYGGDILNVNATFINNFLLEDLWIAGTWNSLDFRGNTLYGNITDSNKNLSDAVKAQNNFEQTNPPTSGNKIFIHNNQYDSERARIVIYNFDDADSVDVNVSALLSEGDSYELHSVYDVYGDAVLSGVYDGKALSVPMGTVTLPQPNGYVGIFEDDDNPKKAFGVFLLKKVGCN